MFSLSVAIVCSPVHVTILFGLGRLVSSPRPDRNCEHSLQLLQQVVSQLPAGSSVQLCTRGVQHTGSHISPHGCSALESCASTAAAASWGILRVAATELPVSVALSFASHLALFTACHALCRLQTGCDMLSNVPHFYFAICRITNGPVFIPSPQTNPTTLIRVTHLVH